MAGILDTRSQIEVACRALLGLGYTRPLRKSWGRLLDADAHYHKR